MSVTQSGINLSAPAVICQCITHIGRRTTPCRSFILHYYILCCIFPKKFANRMASKLAEPFLFFIYYCLAPLLLYSGVDEVVDINNLFNLD